MTHRDPPAQARLLAAALEEFSRFGPLGARTDRIAEKAGVNKQLIHYYFGTKTGLYEAALEYAGREVADALARIPLVGLTAVERLRRLVRGQFEFLLTHEQLTAMLVRAESGGQWAQVALEPLTELLTEGQATGFFRDDIDPRQHARLALLLHLGYFALRPITAAWGEPSSWRDRSVELIVRGCTW